MRIRLLVILVLFYGAPSQGQTDEGCLPTLADPLGLLGECHDVVEVVDEQPTKNVPAGYQIVDRRDEIGPDGFPLAMREDHIFFLEGGAVLSPVEVKRIELLGKVLKTKILSKACLRLVGHGDASGSAEANQKMSESRAQVVADALAAELDDPARILEVFGRGETELLPDFEPTAAEQRRVAIYAKTCSP